ncbi:MAG TPA: VWA domain-containing protein [Dehalococcoidia bacterium]|nr:VWA domain-containing protein [Dehalococcoidia bacterium]
MKNIWDMKSSGFQKDLGRVFFTLCMCLMAGSLVVRGRQSGQAPVFKSKVEIVQLDVSVLDKHRQPVKGLTKENFTILEDGKPRNIVGFSTFEADTAEPASGWMRDVPSDVTTNDLKPETRLFVIVMDDAMIPAEPGSTESAKKIATEIIDRIGPSDRLAIVFTADNRKTQDFTNDKTKLRGALEKFQAGGASYRFGLDVRPPANVNLPPPGDPRAVPPLEDTDLYFYQSSIRTLQSVAELLAAIPERRKSLFWVSPGVPVDLTGAMPADRDGNEPYPEALCLQGDRAICQRGNGTWIAHFPATSMVDLNNRTKEIFAKAQRANVTIYPIDPTGLDGMKNYLGPRLGPSNTEFARHKATIDLDYLTNAAANTGGRAIINTNEYGPEIGGIFDENRSYYLIAIEPANPVADGKLHKLQVKVDRQDVEVRTRTGYYAPEAQTKEDKKIAKSKMTPEAVALTKAMAGILPTVGMPLRAAVAPFAVPGQKTSMVTIVLGVTQPIPASAADFRVNETTELLTSAFTPEGEPRGAQTHKATVAMRKGTKGEATYEVLARIDLPPGRYQLRLAAHNTTAAKDGSVFVDVTVPDYGNLPFSASPLVLSSEPAPVSAPKGLFLSLLPMTPTAERTFSHGDAVTGFMRLYQSGQKPIEPVAITMRLRDATDRIEVQGTKTMAAAEFDTAARSEKGAKGVQPLASADLFYDLPVSRLASGAHLLTLEASLGSTTVRRDVRFEIR